MAIDITSEVIKHDDEEIIEFLLDEVSEALSIMRSAIKAGRPELCLTAFSSVGQAYNVLRALDRRNKERGIK